MPSDSFRKGAKGAAGVHLVVAQLSLMGHVALPTTRNLKSVDVVAFNESLKRFAFLQVKTTDKPKGGWLVHTTRKEDGWDLDIREALARSGQFFYVFVLLSQIQPEYFVVPSADVAEMVVCGMKKWLDAKPGRKAVKQPCAWEYGGPGKETIEKYRGKWELLGLDE